jgi:hypothetical protein
MSGCSSQATTGEVADPLRMEQFAEVRRWTLATRPKHN